ncbi:LysM domain-containing protein [Metarhizium album ARSEF 1941]|uniref:LysM domain-containing protein n=1 Tax=Metarhizium album (strain ARSEF 1941) TaxID=1081103 RepID=A0A0B2WLQ1_METAS|nr:LysM domain-containing protein [Metarhizium album ARSEF 1941]KHN93945.1 LysM domain-containing protein [Metarhizium album ARSEF 1941]
MVPPGDVAYPATFIIDRLLFAAGMSCLKDSARGQYCDSIAATRLNQAQNCSECALAAQAKQLASPFGYNSAAASDFAVTTSSCAANSYGYATPTAYALNGTTGGPWPAPSCASGRTYVIKKDDDGCNAIAGAQNVSTEALISVNGLDVDCNSMPAVGASLCLPASCSIYQVQPDDSCADIAAAANITIGQLLAWNPVISPGCTTLTAWAGRYICLSSPVGTVQVHQGHAATTEAPLPTATQPGSTARCAQWYSIRSGDTCASISLAFALSLDDFHFLNSGVDKATCNNLWLGYSYCVKPVGDIETYAGYPVSVPSTTFAKPPPETPVPIPSLDPPALLPRAPDTIDGCQLYMNAYPDSLAASDADLNSCRVWASFADITLAQLKRWNPSLKDRRDDDCFVSSQHSYCLLKEDDMNDPLSVYTSTAAATPTTPATSPPPAETQSGAAEDCNKWHVVQSGDGCYDLAQANGILLDDFYKWNPGVGQDCAQLWLGYAVCVGV